MAKQMDDLEFWLPSEFLTDDDLLTDFKTDPLKTTRCDDSSYGSGSYFGFSSDLSSPVESVTGTTETESDEDEFITELSRKVAQTTLQDSGFSSGYTAKNLKLSGSPQSTLCGFKVGSRGYPSNASRVSSPPAAKDAPAWDLLYAAAKEAADMSIVDETTAFQSAKLFGPPAKPSPVSAPQQNPNAAMWFYPNQNQTQAQFSYQQLQAAKFQQMKQQQMMSNGAWEQGIMEYQLQNTRRNYNGAGRAQAHALPTAAWPTLQQSQQKPGSGMRAVFLGENQAKKERTGTGVFMPRRFNSSNPPTETRRKPAGCSTVLIPDRVVHALNLNLDSIDAKIQHKRSGSFTNEYDVPLKQSNNTQHRSLRSQPVTNQELRLPQEWTY